MIINLSSHPSTKWNEKRLKISRELSGDDKLIDKPFPYISPLYTTEDILKIVEGDFEDLQVFIKYNPNLKIIIEGDVSFVHYFVNKAEKCGIKCYTPTYQKSVTKFPDGNIVTKYEFEQFRKLNL